MVTVKIMNAVIDFTFWSCKPATFTLTMAFRIVRVIGNPVAFTLSLAFSIFWVISNPVVFIFVFIRSNKPAALLIDAAIKIAVE